MIKEFTCTLSVSSLITRVEAYWEGVVGACNLLSKLLAFAIPTSIKIVRMKAYVILLYSLEYAEENIITLGSCAMGLIV